jgi:Zn-dependent peptidase ImmA (M78 family)
MLNYTFVRIFYKVKVTQNISRLKYLMAIYGLSMDELLLLISEGLTKPITKEEVLAEEIKVTHLKRIDQIFEKGLHFYLDPKAPDLNKEASIFFRKEKFNTDLNIGAKKIVNRFEDFKIALSAIAKLSDIKFERKVGVFSTAKSARKVATRVRSLLYPEFYREKREFLKALIAKFASANILVFEFVETWNKIDKANIDGFFLMPNVIVVKRNQAAMRREIFTLAHELGHYLLKEEEVEEFDYSLILDTKLSLVERWCNDFAYYFLAGNYADQLDSLSVANASNDYHHDILNAISEKTHLSKIALYTRLLFEKKISRPNYAQIKNDIDTQIKERIEKERWAREQEALLGKQGGSVPKAINSPLLISTIQTAFHEGIIDEVEVCRTLNIKPEHLDDYIQ